MSAPDTIDTKAELKAVSLDERKLLRLLLLVPGAAGTRRRTLAAQKAQLPSTPARELLAAMIADRERDREAGGTGPLRADAVPGLARRRSCTAWRSPFTRSAARTRTNWTRDRVGIGVDQCLLALEADRLKAQMEYISAEIIEAESAGDAESKARLLETNRNLYEALKSLGRRRQDTSLLASAGGHR